MMALHFTRERLVMKATFRLTSGRPQATFRRHTAAWILPALLLLAAITAGATSFVWINPAGGDWNDTNNWTPSSVSPPGPRDEVFITAPGTYAVTGNGSASSLTLGDGSKSFPTLLMNQTGVSVSGSAYAAPGSFIVLTGGDGTSLFGGGSFSASGGLTLDGEIDWQAGRLGGAVTVTTNGVIRGLTALNHFFGATVYNHGRILWSADNLTSDGSWLQNMPDGTLDFQGDTEFGTFGGATSYNILINNGLMLKSAGTNILSLDGPYYVTNSGALRVESGTVAFYNNVEMGGIVDVTNGAALWLESGVFTLSPGYGFTGEGFYGVPTGGSPIIYGTIADANFQMNGTLHGTNSVAGTMTCYAGDFEGATTVASSGVLNLYACQQCGSIYVTTRTGGALTNAGTINWLSGDWTSLGGLVNNLSNGLIDIQCDASLESFGGTGPWLNAGVIRKSAGAGANDLVGMTLTNLGLVDVQVGGLSFPNGFTSGGAFNAASGASVLLASGTFNLNPGHSFAGEGFYGVPSGGGVTVYGEIPGTNFQMLV
jgi:hypothetical protein